TPNHLIDCIFAVLSSTLLFLSAFTLLNNRSDEENNENIYGSSFAGCRFAGYPGSGPGKSGL
ncbi:hypothetical protein, partial [Parabacteroides merdae]|uniref:hypothetical protein n=1 Tax=Parabacteroides merdae TaxID=46503 RepID=UPI0039B50E94